MFQVLQRVLSLNQFQSLCENDQLSLLLCCWHRLLLWICAKNKFSFQVISKPDKKQQNHGRHHGNFGSGGDTMNQPSMAFVKCECSIISSPSSLLLWTSSWWMRKRIDCFFHFLQTSLLTSKIVIAMIKL